MSRAGLLTKGADYKHTVRTGNRVGTEYFVIYTVFVSRETISRFGYIITKQVGNAVVRNLLRRRLKAITNEIERDFPASDTVIRVFPKVTELSYGELREQIHKALARQQRKFERSATGGAS